MIELETIATAGGFFLVAAVIITLVSIKQLIVICPPNRIAIISGRKRVLSNGRVCGLPHTQRRTYNAHTAD